MFQLIFPFLHLCYLTDPSITNSTDEVNDSNSSQPSPDEAEALDLRNSLSNKGMAETLPSEMSRRSQPSQTDTGLSDALNSSLDTDNGTNGDSSSKSWEITDPELEEGSECDAYEEWPDGDVKKVYSTNNKEVKKHRTGWAMRNCNNHRSEILKKSCIGIFVCGNGCRPFGEPLAYKPAICNVARRKQIGSKCPTPGCDGKLVHMACTGKGGFPVTQAWRHYKGRTYFEAKGRHDHPRPMLKIPYTRRKALRDKAKSLEDLKLRSSNVAGSRYIDERRNNSIVTAIKEVDGTANKSQIVYDYHPPNAFSRNIS